MAKVSVIIPTKTIDSDVKRCLMYLNQLPQDKEIIVVDDSIVPGLPARKRNWAMKQATGEYFAFLDSDAYPSMRWLKNALWWLRYYPAVCGPGVLPHDAPMEERVADQVHQWMFAPYRVIPQEHRMVPWFPTFNLIVRRDMASEFENYLTGEDDKFGMNIKGGIFYHPSIMVYHNRRGAFKPLWRQFGTWGKHKGHFLRLAILAYISTIFVYAFNFVKGFFKRKL
jgi:glycosyltransferase involved in cell wall biosynthesis